jgi:hypothetical protein
VESETRVRKLIFGGVIMVTGATDETNENNTNNEKRTIPEGFEGNNWGVFLQNGADNPTLVGSARGKNKTKLFITEYLETNPNINRESIVARPLGKAVHVQMKQVPTL